MRRPAVRRPLVPIMLIVLLAGVTSACGDETPGADTTAAPAVETTVELADDAAPPSASGHSTGDDDAPTPDDATEAAAQDRPVLGVGDFDDVTPAFDLYGENFESPSGNIQCVVYPDDEEQDPYVQCEVFEADWSVPEDNCELDWVDTEVSLSDLPYAGGCRGDTFLSDNPVTLQYGEGWSMGPLTCVSREDGVLCSNADTDSGFLVSRGSLTIF